MRDLSDFPRAPLFDAEPPRVPLPRLSERLGIDLWIQHDDMIGTPFGGNKMRQLEYYLGAAQAADADTILITGAVQSNFVRTAAYAAARLGMSAVVQLEERVPDTDAIYQSSGNVLLLQVLGAEIMRYPEGEDEAGADAAVRARADALRAEGRRPYVIPLALNNPPLGALGYVRAGQMIAQDAPFDVVVVASGSGATHGGLLAGLRSGGSRAQVIGSCVRRPAAAQMARMTEVIRRLAALTTAAQDVTSDDLTIWDGALEPGYGRLGSAAAEAMRMMAQTQGILLDPVYTAKVFAAIPAMVATGEIAPNSRVLFVHTGGVAATFAYQTALADAFAPNPV